MGDDLSPRIRIVPLMPPKDSNPGSRAAKDQRRQPQVTFILPPGIDPSPSYIFRGKSFGLKLRPLEQVSDAESVGRESFSKLFEFSREYLDSVMATLPKIRLEEEEEMLEAVDDS
jgi:hypothetical protein